MSKHRWSEPVVWGVESGCGRPHGVDITWTCKKCGATKSNGPASTCTGKRVIRWTYRDGDGYECDRLPACRS
jgi:hypothetical protein